MKKKVLDSKVVAGPKAILMAVVILAILGTLLLINKNNSTNQPSKNEKVATGTQASNGAKSLEFKEFGVKVNLPSTLSNMKYSVGSPPASPDAPSIVLLRLNDEQYTKIANKCAGTPPATEQSFATLIKTPQLGNIPPSVEPLKQFDNFYIGNLGPALQNPTCNDGATQKSFADISKKLDAALKEAFQTAQKV